MIVCPGCQARFEGTAGDACPSCGAAPELVCGFPAFAPALALDNDGMPDGAHERLAAVGRAAEGALSLVCAARKPASPSP